MRVFGEYDHNCFSVKHSGLEALIFNILGLGSYVRISFHLAWLIYYKYFGAIMGLPQTDQPCAPSSCSVNTSPCPTANSVLQSQLIPILLSVWFQEEDLNCVRERWSEALIKRREYLDEQIKKIINKHGESQVRCYSYRMMEDL